MHNRLQWLCGHLRKIYALVKVLVHLAHNCTARPRTRIFVGLCTGKSGGAGLACLWNVRAVKQRQQQQRRRSAWHAHVVTANDIQPQWHLLHAHVRGKHPLEALLEDHIERLVEACAGSGSRGVEGWSVVIAIKAARSWAAPFRHPMMLRPSLVMTDTVRSKRASIHYHSPGPRRAEQRFQKLSSLFILGPLDRRNICRRSQLQTKRRSYLALSAGLLAEMVQWPPNRLVVGSMYRAVF